MKTCQSRRHQYEGRRCKKCQNEYRKVWVMCNKEYCRAYDTAWHNKKRKENREKDRQYQKEYRAKNPEKTIINNKNNRERHLEARRMAEKEYARTHRGIRNATAAKRYANKLQRTPKWLTVGDFIEMRWAYQIAQDRTKETGIKYEVDHIFPINGKLISGLHVPANLQVITKTDNLNKSNKLEAS